MAGIAAVVCLLCFFVSVVYAGVRDVRKASVPVSKKVKQAGSQGEFNVNSMQYSLQRIYSANPFATKVERDNSVKANKTQLKLTLEGVIAAGDTGLSKAIIRTNKKKPRTYGLGQKIEGTNATLDSVESGRVLIERVGVLESLELRRQIIQHKQK